MEPIYSITSIEGMEWKESFVLYLLEVENYIYCSQGMEANYIVMSIIGMK